MQEITVTLRLIIEENGTFTLVEKKEHTSDSGSTVRFLVEDAVLPLDTLPASNPAIETDLEEIIGYSCGIDMTPTLDYHRRVTLLTYALSSTNWSERRQGAQALGMLYPLSLNSVPNLVSLLSDSEENVMFAAADALAEMYEDPQVFRLLNKLTDDPNARVRRGAAFTLYRLGQSAQAALHGLIKAAQTETDGDAFYWEINAIASMTSQENTLPILKEALTRSQVDIRIAACKNLSEYSFVPGAIDLLISSLSDNASSVQEEAIGSISLWGRYSSAKSAVPALIEKLSDPDSHIRLLASDALYDITGENLGDDAQKWTDWWELNKEP